MSKKPHPQPVSKRERESPNLTYVRFSFARRIEHLVMLLSFATLGLTGLAQKFSNASPAVFIVGLLGGIETLRQIHHTAAMVMMLGTAWHLLIMGYQVFVLRSRLSMLPSVQDVKDGWQVLKYNLGLVKSYPQMGRYTFEEKLEYWAFVWGVLIMGLTGFLMWNPITATSFLPGQFIPAAKAAHGNEALLAVLAIIIWHMYAVHLKRFNKAMWLGTQSEAEMLHEHPLELADLKAGIADRRPDSVIIRKRRMIYYPIATVLTVIILGALYGFVNAEETALTTLPPMEGVAIYVPQTSTPSPTLPPTNTALPAPTSETTPPANQSTWDGAIGALFAQKCLACHGASATSGLILSTYTDAMKGGQDGAIFIPGEAANSLLIIKFESGLHPYAVLPPEELALIKDWINNGAAEK